MEPKRRISSQRNSLMSPPTIRLCLSLAVWLPCRSPTSPLSWLHGPGAKQQAIQTAKSSARRLYREDEFAPRICVVGGSLGQAGRLQTRSTKPCCPPDQRVRFLSRGWQPAGLAAFVSQSFPLLCALCALALPPGRTPSSLIIAPSQVHGFAAVGSTVHHFWQRRPTANISSAHLPGARGGAQHAAA